MSNPAAMSLFEAEFSRQESRMAAGYNQAKWGLELLGEYGNQSLEWLGHIGKFTAEGMRKESGFKPDRVNLFRIIHDRLQGDLADKPEPEKDLRAMTIAALTNMHNGQT